MMIFFDIDDTLIDQRRAEIAAARQFLAVYSAQLAHCYSLSEFCARWRALREKHAPAFFSGAISVHEQRRRRIRELFAAAGCSLSDCDADRCLDVYAGHYRRNWLLFDDVRPALSSLTRFRRGIISNGGAVQQNDKLRRTGIARFFELVVVSEEIGAAKPRREIFLAACRRAGVAASRCIYVGDRLDHDTLPSRSVGMGAYLLCRGKRRAPPGIEAIGSLTELAWRLPGRSAA